LVELDRLTRCQKECDWLTEKAIRRAQKANTPARIQRYKSHYQAWGQFDYPSPDRSFGMSSVSVPEYLTDETATRLDNIWKGYHASDNGVLGGIFSLSSSAISGAHHSVLPGDNTIIEPVMTTPRKSFQDQIPSPSRPYHRDWVYYTPPKTKRGRSPRPRSPTWHLYNRPLAHRSMSVADAISRRAELEREVMLLKCQPPPIWNPVEKSMLAYSAQR
jgi:hypothetical protein